MLCGKSWLTGLSGLGHLLAEIIHEFQDPDLDNTWTSLVWIHFPAAHIVLAFEILLFYIKFN